MTVRINKTISVLKLGPLGQPTGLPKNCALFSSGSFYFKSKFPSVWPNTKKLAKKRKQIILTFSAETLGENILAICDFELQTEPKHSLNQTVSCCWKNLLLFSVLDFSVRAAWPGHWLLGRAKQL